MYRRVAQISLVLAALAVYVSAQSSISVIAPDVMASDRPGPSDAIDSGRVEGLVTTIDGRPLREVSVSIRSVSNGSVLASGYTRVNGTFEFNNVPNGQYEVVATKGVDQSHQRVDVNMAATTVNLRMATAQAEPGAGDTVSVQNLQVPSGARSEYGKAYNAFQKNKLDEALKHSEKALEKYANYPAALTLRGILRVNKKDSGGIADMQKAIDIDSNYAMAYFALGATQNQQGQYQAAQKTLEQGLRVDPVSWQGYFELSKSLLGQGDYRNALKNVVRAQGFENSYAPMHLVKAHALIGLKFYGEAAQELQQFLAKDPKSPNAAAAQQELSNMKAFAAVASE